MKINDEEMHSALLVRRQILVAGKIDANIQVRVTNALLYLNSLNADPITMLFDSFGGSNRFGYYMIDAIRNSHAPVDGLVVGDCASMAFNILQACRVRRAYEHACFMFHYGCLESAPAKDLAKCKRILEREDAEAFEMIAQRSKQPLSRILKWAAAEHKWTATEALKHRFIDEITKP